jgi:hypothetical protein
MNSSKPPYIDIELLPLRGIFAPGIGELTYNSHMAEAVAFVHLIGGEYKPDFCDDEIVDVRYAGEIWFCFEDDIRAIVYDLLPLADENQLRLGNLTIDGLGHDSPDRLHNIFFEGLELHEASCAAVLAAAERLFPDRELLIGGNKLEHSADCWGFKGPLGEMHIHFSVDRSDPLFHVRPISIIKYFTPRTITSH